MVLIGALSAQGIPGPTHDNLGELLRERADVWARAQVFGPIDAYWFHRHRVEADIVAWADIDPKPAPIRVRPRGVSDSTLNPAPVPPSDPGASQPTPEQWAALRHCEATGNYQAVNPSGKYRGAYQFDQATWESVGGTGDPAAATPAEQDLRAAILYANRGRQPWPQCGRFLP